MLRDCERRVGLRALATATQRVAGLDATQARLAALLDEVPVPSDTTSRKAAAVTRAALGAAAERVATAQRAAVAGRNQAARGAARLIARADAVAAARSRTAVASCIVLAARS